MMLVICVGGTICMENPHNSLIALHERFAWLVTLLQSHSIPVLWLQQIIYHMFYDKCSSRPIYHMFYHISYVLSYIICFMIKPHILSGCSFLLLLESELYKCAFWMRKHMAMTWKRTWLWSTSWRIRDLDLGPLLPSERVTQVKTTKRWKKDGKTKWQGTKALKGTQ